MYYINHNMKKRSMKKLIYIIPFAAIAIGGLTGCFKTKSDKPYITYGTLVDTEATELKYADLQLKVSDNENMLIAVWQDTEKCGCWDNFHTVLNKYVREYHTKVYYIRRTQFNSDADSFGLSLLNDTTKPTFAFIKNGKKDKEYIYNNDNKPLFETLDGLRSTITKFANDPQYYYVDQAYLDNALFVEKQDKVVVQYVWHSCPDCNYSFPNVMVPYSNKHAFSTKIWLIDLEIKGILLNDEGIQDKTNANYVEFMKTHHLSKDGDETFGYDRGFVPSTQVWEKGSLIDMNVYFNDTVEEVDGKYVITQSYYSEERVSHLNYTNTVLKGQTINEEEMDTIEYGDLQFKVWNKDYAAKRHNPIIEAFLDKYVK